MLLLPTLEQVGGVVGALALSGLFILAYGFVTYHSRRFSNLLWPSRADIAQREAEQAARTWNDLYGRLVDQVHDLNRRVTALEAGDEDSRETLTTLRSHASKVERAMRRRDLWDSTEAKPQ